MSSQSHQTGQWIKATMSGGGDEGTCVEMRRQGDVIEVRDSKHPDGPSLGYTRDEFAAWLDGAKEGEFDHLA
jgi:hypothetical protein